MKFTSRVDFGIYQSVMKKVPVCAVKQSSVSLYGLKLGWYRERKSRPFFWDEAFFVLKKLVV